MIKRVLIDLDDVLAEFAMAAIYYAGATKSILPYDEFPVEAGWDIVSIMVIMVTEILCPE